MNLRNLNQKNIIFPAFIAAAALLFFAPVFIGGKTFYPFDNLLYSLPWSCLAPGYDPANRLIGDAVNDFYSSHSFIKHCFENMVMPFWNPLSFCGASAGNHTYTSPVFFILFYLLPICTAHDVLLFIHLAASGIFTYFYLRRIGLLEFGALFGAAAWMFNAYIMVWFEVEYLPVMGAMLPAALLFIDNCLRKPTLLSWLGIVISIALAAGASYAQSLYYHLIFIGVYFLYRVWACGKRNWKFIFKQSLLFTLAVLTAFILVFNFFVLHSMLYQDGQRGTMNYQEIFDKGAKVLPDYLITMIYPDFFGNPAFKTFMTPNTPGKNLYNNYSELCIYGGVLTFFLVVTAAVHLRRRGYILFYLSSALAVLFMAMGSFLYYPLTLLPGLNFANPSRILYIFGFAYAMLAAIGMDIIHKNEYGSRKCLLAIWTLIFAGAAAIGLSANTCILYRNTLEFNWHHFNEKTYAVLQEYLSLYSYAVLHPLILILLSFVLLCVVIFMKNTYLRKVCLLLMVILTMYDLGTFALTYNTASPRELEYPETPAIKFLKTDNTLFRYMALNYNGIFMDNLLVPYNIEDIGGYASVFPRRYAEYIFISQHPPDTPLPKSFSHRIFLNNCISPLLDLINTKYLLLPPSAGVNNKQFRKVYDKEIRIYENLNAFPRIFFVPEYLYCATRAEALEKLRSFSSENFRKTVILEDMPTSADRPPYALPVNYSIDIKTYKPGTIVFSADINTSGFLVIGNSYNKWWTARIDGHEEKILRANYIMQALPVKAGQHKIELVYKPYLMIAGVYISVLGWLIVIGILLWCVIKRKKTEI